MTFNTALSEKILAQVLMYPETHEQSSWEDNGAECGTTHCIGGWAVELSPGYTIALDGFIIYAVPSNGTRDSIGRVAAQLLGLGQVRAEELFFHSTEDQAIELLKFFANNPEGDSLP